MGVFGVFGVLGVRGVLGALDGALLSLSLISSKLNAFLEDGVPVAPDAAVFGVAAALLGVDGAALFGVEGAALFGVDGAALLGDEGAGEAGVVPGAELFGD